MAISQTAIMCTLTMMMDFAQSPSQCHKIRVGGNHLIFANYKKAYGMSQTQSKLPYACVALVLVLQRMRICYIGLFSRDADFIYLFIQVYCPYATFRL
jgi:hypothetical protein